MKLEFYGVRGSHPKADRRMMNYGGNTTCLYLRSESGQNYIVDAGTGIVDLGSKLLQEGKGKTDVKVFITHDHWDHIQGFPFFTPAYIPNCNVDVYSGDKKLASKLGEQDRQTDTARIKRSELEKATSGHTTVINRSGASNHTSQVFEGQQMPPYFPVPVSVMGPNLRFHDLKEGELVENGLTASYMYHSAHPGGMFSYKFQEKGKTFVFAGDFEHDGESSGKFGSNDKKLIDWAKDADVLVIDAQYTPEEYEGKKGWGHSQIERINEIAKEANVKRLFITHHDPAHTDEKLDEMQERARKYMKEVLHSDIPVNFAREGMGVII